MNRADFMSVMTVKSCEGFGHAIQPTLPRVNIVWAFGFVGFAIAAGHLIDGQEVSAIRYHDVGCAQFG